MSDLLAIIRDGVQYKENFSYDGIECWIRPLTSVELDAAEDEALKLISDARLVATLINIRLGKIDILKPMDIPPALYTRMREYFNTVDYHVVFKAMQKFMPSDFSLEDVKKMQYVHELAVRIRQISRRSDSIVQEFLQTKGGQELVEIVYTFHQPLAMIKDLTDIQKRFLYYGSGKAPKKVANSLEEFDNLLNSGAFHHV